MHKPKVYSYLRFSDPKQATRTSIERQLDYATRWAAENGMDLDTAVTMRDEGLSAYHQRHVKNGALGVFLAAVDAGAISPGSVLVVEGLDRLSRAEPILAQAQLTQIINAGISVVTASDGRTYNRENLLAQPMDLVFSLLVMIRAHEESDTKSKRVKAAIRKMCQGWLDGKYRGLIRNGKDPSWVIETDGKFAIYEPRAEAFRKVIELWRQGHGFASTMNRLQRTGYDMSLLCTNPVTFYKMLQNPALIGTKTITLDGITYSLEDYYPPLIDRSLWDELQELRAVRHRAKGKGLFPSIFTGIGVCICGYCGRSITSQTIYDRPKKQDGTMQDGHRRLHCAGGHHRCDHAGSASAIPVERAILTYCSDQINLDKLTQKTTEPEQVARAELITVRRNIAAAERALGKVTDALIADESGPTPLAFIRKARELEDQIAALKQQEAATETAMAKQRPSTNANALAWQKLIKGVLDLDVDTRMQARSLIEATFSRIALYFYGVIPGDHRSSPIDIVLIAKGGSPRLLRIHRRTGELIEQEDFDIPAEE